MDFRLAAQPASPAVERSSFSDVSFLGDSLTQGMQLYDTGLPNAHFCAYKGVGPNAVVNNTTCRRADGEKEVPMEALASQQPRALYILLGTNVLTTDSDYTSFLTYYRLMLDMISQALPNTKIYVQSITPVRPEVSKKSPGLYKERLCEINDALSAIALEKGCTFLNLWEALADENGDLIEDHTVILSSHILSEVQAVCSRVLILSKGALVAEGTPEQLSEKLSPGIRLRVTALGSSDTVLPVVEAVPGITGVQLVSEADGEVTFTAETADTTDRRAEVSHALSEAGCTVLELTAENRSLEEVFLALTGETADVPEEPETEPKGE